MNPLAIVASAGPHIEIKAEGLFSIGGLEVTNALLLGILGYSVVVWLLFSTARSIKNGKKSRLASFIMMIYEMLYGTVEQVVGSKTMARRIAPLSITLFFVIIVNYWLGIIPIAGPITWNGMPLLRGMVADMNTTFAFAIISMVMVQVYAVKSHGFFGNLKRYFVNPFKDPIGCFVGILEIIAEISRLVALSLRLFGNVFAGEVLMIVVGYMTAYFASVALLPFMIFELFIGSIQAYVFFMLTTVFIALGMESHASHDDHPELETKPVEVGSV